MTAINLRVAMASAFAIIAVAEERMKMGDTICKAGYIMDAYRIDDGKDSD
jgi:hypothetical protein